MVKQEDVYTLTGSSHLRNINMRDTLIKALLAHAQGDIAKHRANVEVYLTNPVGIGEHSNVLEAIEEEAAFTKKKEELIKF